MRENRRFARELLQGLLSFVILYYVVSGDSTRFPQEICGDMPRSVFNSPVVFLACISLLFFMEGVKAVQNGEHSADSPVGSAISCYIPYWRVCVPLTAIGYALFNVAHGSALYSPMFENPSFPNIARGIFALTNNIHEGAWLVPCLAICVFFAALYPRARERRGVAGGIITLAGSVVAAAVLFLAVMPFHYHRMVYRAAAIVGPCAFATGFLMARGNVFGPADAPEHRAQITGSRAMAWLLAPVRFVGRNWLAFWLLQFYIAYYYYNIPYSVYTVTGSINLGFPIILIICIALLFAMEWGYSMLSKALKYKRWTALAILAPLLAAFLLHFALETSVDYGAYAKRAAAQLPVYTLASVLAIFCLIMLLRAITGRWSVATVISVIALTLLGVANHYTMKYHGTLLMVEEFRNLKTAANVIGEYDLSIDQTALRVLLYGAGGIACCVAVWAIGRKARLDYTRRQRWISRALCLIVALSVECLLYFCPKPVVDKSKNIWNWIVTYAQIGYFSGTVESTLANSGSVLIEPGYYSQEQVERLSGNGERQASGASAVRREAANYPDIVMILNETYYDLEKYIDMSADVDYMRNYNALDNAIKGYTVTPFAGGNTNASEYELLTANSMTLIRSNAPFNRLNLTDQVALPNYLKQLGYYTIGAHPHSAQNYLRSLRWQQMGFDATYFLPGFSDLEYYGNRGQKSAKATDVSVFKNLAHFMDDMPEDQPRFAFLITMQNHGGWSANTPEQALVHGETGTRSQKLASTIDEYLSCISLTDDLIATMRDYYTRLYETTGRKVIVCMAGDHSPSFISDLSGLCKWEDEDFARLISRSTPYFIWANYPLELDGLDLAGVDNMDMACLTPTLLDVAGLPLSRYYRHAVDLRGQVSAITYVGGNYKDEDSASNFCGRDGVVHNVEEDNPLAEAVRDYYIMEYNLIAGGGGRELSLFTP